jgi:hypothetical protein
MAELDEQHSPSSQPVANAPLETGHYHSLVLASAILATVGTLLAGGYAVVTGLLVLKALSLEIAVVALTAWLCLNANRIRRRLSELDPLEENEENERAEEAGKARWEEDEYGEEIPPYDVAVGDIEHARKLHFVFLAVCPIVAIGFLSISQLWTGTAGSQDSLSAGRWAALAVVCLAASCVWLALAKSYAAGTEEALLEGSTLELAFREAQWASLLVAAVVLGSLVWWPLEVWVGRLLLIWIVTTCGEHLFRLLFAWLRPTPEGSLGIPPMRLAVREALLVSGNPISSLFQTVEERFGVSFRSSWAIGFVRRATIPVLLLVVLLLWGLSSLCVVRIDNLGVRESFGRVTAAPLEPGLHWKLPWPFGRVRQFPVKRVSTQTIGFVSGERRQPAYLWSKQHAEREFALVLGAGSEVVAVDSMLYYKTREDSERFLEYVYRWQNPEEALEAYAYRSLMEQTRSATLDDVLSARPHGQSFSSALRVRELLWHC